MSGLKSTSKRNHYHYGVCVCVCVCLSHFPMSRSVLSFMSLSVTKMMKRSLLSPIIHHMRYDHRFPHVHNTNIQNKNNICICTYTFISSFYPSLLYIRCPYGYYHLYGWYISRWHTGISRITPDVLVYWVSDYSSVQVGYTYTHTHTISIYI